LNGIFPWNVVEPRHQNFLEKLILIEFIREEIDYLVI